MGSITTSRTAATDPRLPLGSNFSRCAACHQYFLTIRAFARHRVGPAADRTCVATPRMADAGLERDRSGLWRLPKREFSQVANTADSGGEVAV